MGDLAADTNVRSIGDGRFTAVLNPDWEIWGPMGGYVAACALRAAGASSDHPRPATFSCHYLGVAEFGPIHIQVEPRKVGRSASSHRVELGQDGRPILDAMVWSVSSDLDGLEHDETVAPSVPGPEGLPSIRDLVPEERQAPYPFWDNFDSRPLEFELDWPPPGPPSGEMAPVAPIPAHCIVLGSMGRRRPERDPRRSAELAFSPQTPRMAESGLCCTDARSQRCLPRPDRATRLAPV